MWCQNWLAISSWLHGISWYFYSEMFSPLSNPIFITFSLFLWLFFHSLFILCTHRANAIKFVGIVLQQMGHSKLVQAVIGISTVNVWHVVKSLQNEHGHVNCAQNWNPPNRLTSELNMIISFHKIVKSGQSIWRAGY